MTSAGDEVNWEGGLVCGGGGGQGKGQPWHSRVTSGLPVHLVVHNRLIFTTNLSEYT